jgi:aconitate decarboxylase
MSYTRELAEWVSHVEFADIPPQTLANVKRVLLDGVGCGLYGATMPWSQQLYSSMARFGSGVSRVIGSGCTLPPDRAALVNGSFIQGYELDDYHQDAGIHSCACVVPAAMAASEVVDPLVSGEDFLLGVLVGFEVGSRLGRCMNPAAVVGMGWHTGSVFAPLAAAAAAGKILRLNTDQMVDAFGIAATQAGGLGAVQYGSMVKRMHHGRGAQSGVYGAVLAAGGYTGILDVFDQGYGGYVSTFVKGDAPHLEYLTDGLGSSFALERIGLKPYACNAGIHSTLDAVRAIADRTELHPDDIEEIVVAMSDANREHVGWPFEKATSTSAQMNLPFCVAALLYAGDVFIEQFTAINVHSPVLANFAKRVRTIHDPTIDALGPSLRHRVEVTIRLKSGATEAQVEEYGRGSPMRPLDDHEVLMKFTKLAELARTARDVEGLGKSILNLEACSDVLAVLDLLLPSLT